MIRSLDGKSAVIDPTAFVSETAYLIGDIEIGPRSSIWPGVVIRADSGKIKIGAGTNIQDNSVLHADDDAEIGDDVTIGHGVVCHARKVGNGSLLGNNSTLNEGVVIGNNSLVAAGSTLNENTVFEDNALVRGTPGKALGTVRERHTALMKGAAASYVRRIERYVDAGLDHAGQSVT
ncbi:MAG: gamma carbonic anhydrase family protein [Dehalococcoidia bacterium]|jgi:carbonic anhydrase/acetyltransferase-like protein (isoleucine patch superfamily)|nr:gamma carbonic anhydrase family protein [Chloroflexota bacterium]MDP6056824.1 gamma carbonic anhydrase family protein [Dehalococcoidia bacterium]MDP7261319.1 gamma carbonic anhydrase family protein [Dehalococcoidia bacterium]MDP7486295.1 gamma carbonic anhydrase family protein [Dehalococcoidia bacterium]|tara:strand:- start:18847 stop:19377 length:531 start_codon:yes stop_codon:yes gene_type:complete